MARILGVLQPYSGGADELLRRNHRPGARHRRVPALAVQGRGAGRQRHPGGAAGPAEAQGRRSSSPTAASSCAACRTRSRAPPGIFKNHGLDVELVYTRGGNAAMQALVGGAVDYAATSLDVAIQAYANVGAEIRRFAVTGRLPLFALVTAPKTADKIQSIKDLEGKTVGVIGARQRRSRADALPAEAGRRRREQGPVRDHGRQSPGGAAPGSDRCRPGAGAGADAAEAGRRRAC